MLESGEALRTWALARAPDPGVAIEAGALPDHRLAYLDYEGPVSGGRGCVERIDRGTFEPIRWEADRVEAHLFGERLAGLIVLARREDAEQAGSRGGWTFRLDPAPDP